MKRILSIIPLLALINVLNAQITVNEHEIQLRASLEDVAAMESPKASSDCGEVTVTIKTQIYSGGCLGTQHRMYTYTDECGNTAKAEQFVLLLDETPPVFEMALENVQCTKDDIPAVESPNVTDNSDRDVKIEYIETINDGEIVRTWKASDPCGNESEMNQKISIIGS